MGFLDGGFELGAGDVCVCLERGNTLLRPECNCLACILCVGELVHLNEGRMASLKRNRPRRPPRLPNRRKVSLGT